MDDLTPLDRQVAAEFLRDAGPSEPVDDAAIFTAITTSQTPRWRFGSMFSATRFVVAGAVVALFGGFLLAGVLTQPSEESAPAAVTDSPDPTIALLPGVDLVTEEVEPGVYRVLSDGTDNDPVLGTRDPDSVNQLVAGRDGSVWVMHKSRLFRLSTEGWVSTGDLDPWSPDISVVPDGTVWARGPDPDGGSSRVFSLADGAWTTHGVPDDAGVTDIDTAADGTVWATLLVEWVDDSCTMNPSNVYGGGRLAVARLGESGWLEEPIDPATTVQWGELEVGRDGPEFLLAGDCGHVGASLLERRVEGWELVSIPEVGPVADWSGISPVEVGRDGTAWAWTQAEDEPWWKGPRLLRRTGDEWEVFGEEEPVPTVVGNQMWDSSMAVSPDGRLWLALGAGWPEDGVVALDSHRATGHSVVATLDGLCPGVLSFDGLSWTHHLAGACVTHVSAAPNGNVWVMVEELDATWFDEWSSGDPERAARLEEADPDSVPAGIYVITPEAVAAGE